MGGTEAFPDLGRHCQYPECNELDFLPFKCDGCKKVFCLEHKTFKSHDCSKSDHKSRKVVVCEICSMAIEVTGKNEEDVKLMMEKHGKSNVCDPKKKKKPTCSVRRCKEILTFSNSFTCKTCQLKVCLRHRFAADHACKNASGAAPAQVNARPNEKFLAAFTSRNGKDCGKAGASSASRPGLLCLHLSKYVSQHNCCN